MEKKMKRFSILSHKVAIAALAAGLGAATLVSFASQAEARDRGRGAAVAAGIIGGLAVGALVAGAANNAYAAPEPVYDTPPPHAYGYHRPAPRRVAYPQGYYEAYDSQPICSWQKQKIWIDAYTYQVRRVQVCE
jgi:hypothetical protein